MTRDRLVFGATILWCMARLLERCFFCYGPEITPRTRADGPGVRHTAEAARP